MCDQICRLCMKTTLRPWSNSNVKVYILFHLDKVFVGCNFLDFVLVCFLATVLRVEL